MSITQPHRLQYLADRLRRQNGQDPTSPLVSSCRVAYRLQQLVKNGSSEPKTKPVSSHSVKTVKTTDVLEYVIAQLPRDQRLRNLITLVEYRLYHFTNMASRDIMQHGCPTIALDRDSKTVPTLATSTDMRRQTGKWVKSQIQGLKITAVVTKLEYSHHGWNADATQRDPSDLKEEILPQLYVKHGFRLSNGRMLWFVESVDKHNGLYRPLDIVCGFWGGGTPWCNSDVVGRKIVNIVHPKGLKKAQGELFGNAEFGFGVQLDNQLCFYAYDDETLGTLVLSANT